jgi:plastocyanin
VQVTNFNIVDKQGQSNAAGEGHLHFYLDVDAPTTPGQPAIPTSGVWAHVASNSFTFTNVAAGMHNISVELVNNNHTPLDPPVVAMTMINVAAPASETPPAPPAPATGQTVTINLLAQNIAFNMKTITVPAGANVIMNFDNKDSVPHNFSLFTDSTAQTVLFQGQIISATTTIYKFTAPTKPGTYFFRCDVHPSSMTGSFIVQ